MSTPDNEAFEVSTLNAASIISRTCFCYEIGFRSTYGFQKQKQREEKAREQLELEEKERQRQIRSYDGVFTEDKMRSNYDGGNDSDDFM